MTPEVAINNIAQVVEIFKGTKKEHELLADSLNAIVSLIQSQQAEDKKKEPPVEPLPEAAQSGTVN